MGGSRTRARAPSSAAKLRGVCATPSFPEGTRLGVTANSLDRPSVPPWSPCSSLVWGFWETLDPSPC